MDLNEFRKLPNLKLNNNNNIFRIIYTGSICIRKGLIYLLKAFTELNLKNTELLLIGEIENKFLKILNKFKNNDSIKILKSMNQSELYKYYNSSNIFVTSSIEDGLSMVQLQAMSCGLPLICTKNSGGEEIVTDGYDGFIIPIRNIEILKEKLNFFMKTYPNVIKWEKMQKKRLINIILGNLMEKMLFKLTNLYCKKNEKNINNWRLRFYWLTYSRILS